MQKVVSSNVLINCQCFHLRLLFAIYTLLTELNQKCSDVDIPVVENPLVTKVTVDVMNVINAFACHQKEEFPFQRERRAVTPFSDNNLSKFHGCTCKFL